MTWGGIGPSGEFKTINHDETGTARVDYEPARGDVSGLIDNLLVIGLQGRPVSPLSPVLGHVLSWNGSAWVPTPVSVTVSGSLTHNLLSPTHPDTIPASPVNGDLITASGGWTRFPVGQPGQQLRVSQGGQPKWDYEPLVVYTSGSMIQLPDVVRRVVVKKTIGSPTQFTLPLVPHFGQEVMIKDGRGDAHINTVTISASGTTIDGFPQIRLRGSYQAFTLLWNGSEWNII